MAGEFFKDGVRWYPGADNTVYPSITSILGKTKNPEVTKRFEILRARDPDKWDANVKFACDNGTLCHWKMSDWLMPGQELPDIPFPAWPKDLNDRFDRAMEMVKGSGLEFGWPRYVEGVVRNPVYQYAGRRDYLGEITGTVWNSLTEEEVELDGKYVLDWKFTSYNPQYKDSVEDYLMQISAYVMAEPNRWSYDGKLSNRTDLAGAERSEGDEPIGGILAFVQVDENKNPDRLIDLLIIEDELIYEHFDKFIERREKFRELYNK